MGMNLLGWWWRGRRADPQGFSCSVGVVTVLLAPAAVAAVYCLAWATSYIVFPFALWSCKA